jgi:integrase
MTKIRLPYVQHWIDQHGKARSYFRKDGHPRVPLPGIPGSGEFMEAYHRALENAAPRTSPRAKEGSISALVAAYYASPGFLRLAESTRNNHRNIAERFREMHGDKAVASLRNGHIRALMHEVEKTPAKANHLLNVIRHLMRLAVLLGWRGDDPTEGIKKVRYREQEIHTWNPSEREKFEQRWPVGSRARLAYALLLYTAQRKSDVVRLGPKNIKEGDLNFVQQKTGVELWVPIHPKLKEALCSTEIGCETFLVTDQGKARTADGFSEWFRDCVKKAGLPRGCTPHGLRKAACVALAELGCTPHQIMAISGHKTLAEVELYTEEVDKKRLGKETMELWARATGTKE